MEKIQITILAGLLVLLGFSGLVVTYRGHVKEAAMDDFEVCMAFNRPDSKCAVIGKLTETGFEVTGSEKCQDAKKTMDEAIEHCLEYARDNNHWRPFLPI